MQQDLVSVSRNMTVNYSWTVSIIALVPCNHTLAAVSHYSGLEHDLFVKFRAHTYQHAFCLPPRAQSVAFISATVFIPLPALLLVISER